MVISCSGRLYVVLDEKILFEFVYEVNGECSLGNVSVYVVFIENLCICLKR
jgi:hypothetical protein